MMENSARIMFPGIDAAVLGGRRALIIEPEDSVRRSLQLMLQGWRYAVRSFGAVAPALTDPYACEAQVLLVAQDLLDGGYTATLLALRTAGWHGRAILVARPPAARLASDARRAGFTAVIDKPVGRLDLLNALAK